MVKQELFIGNHYYNGIYGKKVMVVGHQKHATDTERALYKDNPMAYNVSTDNTDMLKELINGECMKWEPGDRKAWMQFGKMLSGNLNFNLGTEQSSKLFDSIAFCNYLQIPDIALDNRQGKDEECLYVYSENIFKEYLEEAKPDKIIVWGEPYKYIKKIGTELDDRNCRIVSPLYGKIDVLKINHPCRVERGGYIEINKRIKAFIQKN